MALPSESEIHQLSPAERIRLIELLWATFVEDPAGLPVTEAQRHELDARVAHHRANPEEAKPWSEVRDELERE